jgi:YidC/Oxa1 family membrane protein insertase
VGLRDRYFCTILEPSSDIYSGFIKKINSRGSEIGVYTNEFTLAAGQEKEFKFDIYLGPQELRHITAIKPEWAAVMYYGTFDFIAHLLLQLLDFIFGLVRNWGTTIVILSLLIYLILFPLTLKQMRSMKQMQALQPRIEELRKMYKDNAPKLNTEIMKLYREYKVNPFSGCLPLILQIPVFFALYQVLIRSVALKGAKFLWIKDLSLSDRLFILPVSLPFLGNEINLLPILMTVGMFVQQKLSMATTSTGSAEQQKLMLILFPLMFGFIFYHMPSGLVLYWFTNSALMLFYQLKISTSTSLSANGERSRTISRQR